MSFGFGFGLPSWQTLSGGFSPASLFTNNEQGVWYEPAPNNGTLFQDSAGTTPVTAVEQFVGLMLDKSKGLVLGSELVTNGDFSNGTTGWTGTLTLAVVNGELQMTRTASGQDVSQIITTVAGQSYKISVSYRNGTTSSAIYIGSTAGGSNLLAVTTLSSAATQTFTAYFTATNATSYIQFGLNALGGTAFIDNVTVKSIAGNHATSTGTKRPKLAARYNLLTYTEDFSNAAWSKFGLTVSANAALAPNGTLTADVLTATSTSGHTVYPLSSLALGAGTYTFRLSVLKGMTFTLTGNNLAVAGGIIFSGTTGAVVATVSSGSGFTISSSSCVTHPSNSNYWLATITFANPGPTNLDNVAVRLNKNNQTAWPGNSNDIGDTLTVWGADLRPASQATGLIGPAYQRVVDAATYDTAGFLPYLQFDGIDDSMSTGSIDATAVDKAQVFAGVRKLSDAAIGVINELSANAGSNNGSLSLTAAGAGSAGAKYGTALRGTTLIFGDTATSYGAPITNVLIEINDIAQSTAATEQILRINGAQASLTFGGADAGTGNFGNYPLYLGGRGGTSLYFNGWLLSLIVRFGANLSQSQIEATESWINQRTGAF